jgi:hypothetical protein
MPGNAVPQFTRIGNIASALLTAALTTSDGSGGTIGTNISVVFTADATNGSYVESVRIAIVASAASTAAAGTTIRIYVSSIASGSTTTANTFLITEVAVPAVTADQATTATNVFDVALGFRLPAGYTILASTHVAANANTGYRVTSFGGDY